MKNSEEENKSLSETKPVTDPCGECMGAAFGDCENCPKGRLEQRKREEWKISHLDR